MGLSFWHIVVVLVVVVLMFGAGKIPRLMSELASGITAFKRGLRQSESESGEPSAPGTSVQASERADDRSMAARAENPKA